MNLSWLDGKKTYLVVCVVLVLVAISQFGNLSPEAQLVLTNAINAGFALAFAALRDAINKQVPAQLQPVVDPLLEKAKNELQAELIAYLASKQKPVVTNPPPAPLVSTPVPAQV